MRPSDVVDVLQRVKRPKALDQYGRSPLGMSIVAEALPGLVSQCFDATAPSRSRMQDVILKGRAFAKDAGMLTSEGVRVVLPLPVRLVIIDVLVAA